MASDEGFKFNPSVCWRDNIFEIYSRENTGNSRNITVSSAGKLLEELGEDCLQTIESLTVAGDLNGTDIRTINKMTSLKCLDLCDANIVEGGVPYQGNLKTENNVFGDIFFRDMRNLAVIRMPNTIKAIGGYVVNKSIKTVLVPNGVTAIGGSAFKECASLTSFDIPDSATMIGNSAFEGCTSLTSIEIPNSVTVIGSSAFKECASLTSIDIPDSVTEIGYYSFSGCTSILTVNMSDNVKKIGGYAFENCSSLASVNVSCSITKIEMGTFIECESLKSIEIPYGVTKIGESAFKKCYSLSSVEIPNSVITIEKEAFICCSSLASLVIPNSVKIIGESVFYDCTSLESIVLSESITKIESFTFERCKSLKSIDMPKSVLKIGEFSFFDCNSLVSINIPSGVVEIGRSSFCRCSMLKSVVIPNNITEIKENTFMGCTSLESVKMSEGIRAIGISAFGGCTSLTSIDIPNSVQEIEEGAFEHCTSAISITIPNSLKTIKEFAFSVCTSLESIVIPKSVTKIESYAFARCESLKTIKLFRSTPLSIDETTFIAVDKSECQLIVPKGSLERYKEDQYWKEFLNISDDLVVLNQLPEVKYGDAGVDLAEYAPEGVALAYESSDSNIARIDGNKLTICGAGEVMVSASLVGEDPQLELIDPVRKFVVGKAELTATAQSYEIKQGDPMPEFAIIYDGFVYDDNAGSLRELPVISCVANDTSVPGEYEILLSGGYDLNYNIKTVNGLLTIKPVSGISDIEGDVKPFSCIVTDGQIIISGLTTSQAVAIYDANGRMCYRANAAEDGTLTYRPDTAGVYIVRSGSQTVKVIVR